MSTTPASAEATEHCRACAAPLADDQRYCLECGEPRPGAGRPLPAALRRSAALEPASVAPSRPVGGSLAVWLVGLACLLVAVGVGVLIGRSGGEHVAAAPITISGAAAGAPSDGATPSAAAPVSFHSDWPAGRSGWTVALQVLPKDGSDAAAVAGAKSAASGRGAADVGALDSDAYRSLTAGSYVVYSGVFGSRAAATSARGRLAKAFGDARVVQVSDTAATTAGGAPAAAKAKAHAKAKAKPAGAGKRASSGSGSAFEKSKKLPKTLGTGGKPPPKDNKPAAGGSGFQEIK
ncbi:MAG: hypothetical protein QOD24_3348 [Solirubrobacteraceae bacterium]|nr:hypothetical protein [Solirubrobacteraceae bacterium]